MNGKMLTTNELYIYIVTLTVAYMSVSLFISIITIMRTYFDQNYILLQMTVSV